MEDEIVYAVRIKDHDYLMKSSSGGAFTAISDFFLKNNNAIVCSVYNYNTHMTEMKLITTVEERDNARGSKYMQSKPGHIYKVALNWLKNNPEQSLLFVGMGCQADGFRKFSETVGVRDRVCIVDIICHGSPSPKLWREYAYSIEKEHCGLISELSFKEKRNGWKNPTAKVSIDGEEVMLNDYVKIFYNRCALRPSCHECLFATTKRKTDITIGDYWGIEKKIPDFYDYNGNSLLIIHSDRGRELFDKIKGDFEYRESNTIDCRQPNLERPTPISKHRKKFWRDYYRHGIKYIMKKYGKSSLKSQIRTKLKKIIDLTR